MNLVVMNLVVMKNQVRKNLLVQKKKIKKIQNPQKFKEIGTKKIKNQEMKLLIKQIELPLQKFQTWRSSQI